MILKNLLDGIGNVARRISEFSLDDSARYLEGMRRSFQLDSYSCGVQATYSILKYYGKNISFERLREELGVEDRGYASELAIYKLLRKKRLKISLRKKATFQTIYEAIDDYEAPILTTTYNYEHWVVIYGYSKDHFLVIDSLPSFVKRDKKAFRKYWDKWGAIVYE